MNEESAEKKAAIKSLSSFIERKEERLEVKERFEWERADRK